MSLPSQSSRNATRSSQVHYRKSSAGPIRKLISLIIIIGIILSIWYIFIRPKANTLAQNEQTDQQIENGSNEQVATNTIDYQSPTRNLPGSGSSNTPEQETQPTRGNQDQGSRSTSNDRPMIINNGSSSDILSSAANQAEQDPRETTPPPSTNPQIDPTRTSNIRLQLDSARRLIAENNRVQARKLLSKTLLNADISINEAQTLRDELTIINNQLLFSPVADPKDSMTEMYTIRSGDSLSKIASRRELATHWKLIARINQISDPSRIRLGQNIKLARGPFHAIVDKSDHRLDLFHGSPAEPSSWLYIRSYDVGLGSNDGTPLGEFVVSANKLENPGWVNPRDSREQYEADDPRNPIGEFWVGLTGVGQYSSLTSLGIHGTIDQDSIGGDESMGCVRLAKGDIDEIFELLAEHISRVMIVP